MSRKPSWLQWKEPDLLAASRVRNVKQYQYGIRDIQIRDKQYVSSSIYVTKPFSIEGNVMEISLETNETQVPSLVAGAGTATWQTSIEYSVCFVETPAPEDWFPILPTNAIVIEHELLFFVGNRAFLRFRRNIDIPMSIYKNGIRLGASEWLYNADNSVSVVYRFDQYALYSVSYSPDQQQQDPWNIEIPTSARQVASYIGADANEGELFTIGTNRNGQISLAKYPSIDYSRINSGDASYQPIRVSLENAAISGPVKGVPLTLITESTTPVYTQNITDYLTGSEQLLTAYNPTPLSIGGLPTQPLIQYRHEGRTLTFLETFQSSNLITNAGINHGDAWIRVKYDYIKASCRLRIILRNTTLDKICTPKLSGYSLTFKTMR